MLNVQALVALGRLADLCPSPCGGWLAASVARLEDEGSRYVHDLWRVPLDGGAAIRLTRGPWNDRSPRFRADGALLFLSNRPVGKGPDKGEDQRSQIWLLPERGEPRRLTDEPLGVLDYAVSEAGVIARAPVWPGVVHEKQREHARDVAEKGPSGLRYTTMTVRHWDAWLSPAAPHFISYDLEGGGRRDLTPTADREHRDVDWDLSWDGRTLVSGAAFVDEDRIHSVRLVAIDVPSGHARPLGPTGRVRHQGLRLDDAGKRVATQREQRAPDTLGARSLVVLDLESGAEETWDPSWDRWPVPAAWIDADTLLCSVDEQGRTDLALVGAHEHEALTDAHTYASAQLVRGGSAAGAVVAIRSGLRECPRPVLVPRPATSATTTATATAAPRALADVSGFDPERLASVVSEELFVPTADGKTVHTYLLRPAGEGPFPTVLWIHGGPISHFGDVWHWRWNPLVLLDAGFAVALPNARGSTGYGHDFAAEVWADWGGRCFDDLMRVTDALAARPEVGALAAMGGSFGGYMTAWIGGQTDRFAALVTHAGLFDLRAFYGVTDYPGFFGSMMGARPWEGDLDRHSPHRGVERWRSPTLVIHGERDFRVPIGEALALFEALQAHGVESELLVFPDENHWILKPRNVEQWYGHVLEFLDRHLRPVPRALPDGGPRDPA